MNIFKTLTSIAALVALAACGGSSSSGGGGGGGESITFNSIVTDGTDLASTIEDRAENGEMFTDPTTLPTSGSASFDGFAAYAAGGFLDDPLEDYPSADEFIDEADAVSTVAVVADFADSTVAITLDNFFDTDTEEAIAGRATATGPIDRDADTDVDFTFTAAGDGTVAIEGANSPVSIEIEGDFIGTNYDAVTGFIDANVDAAEGPVYFEGIFVAD